VLEQFYNKQLVKTLFKVSRREAEESYRFYLIVQRHFYRKAGRFTLDELLDILHVHYNYRTLHHEPGNNRTKFKNPLRELFNTSMLFKKLPPWKDRPNVDLYRIVSEKRFGDRRRAVYVPVNDTDLKSKRGFVDALLGVVMDGNNFKGIERTAEQTGYTPRRVQQAVRRNNESGRFIKVNNLVIVEHSDTARKVEDLRFKLYHFHGINTPEIIRVKHRGGRETFVLAVYAANSYYRGDSEGHKGQHYLKSHARSSRRLKPVPSREAEHYKAGTARLWEFTRAYTFENYLEEHGFKGRTCHVAA